MQEGLLTLYSEVESSPVRWLWYPYIAIGKITLLQGDPGDGKSTMMMNLIAEITTGGAFPDGKPLEQPQRVIYQCSEDGVADTIKPRLEEQGADCSKVAFINEEVNSGLTLDDERIRDAIVAFRPRLVVIDPIQAYLSSDSDLQIAGKARRLMQHLGMWAATDAVRAVFLHVLHQRVVVILTHRRRAVLHGFAAARKVRNNILRSGPSCVVVIQTEDDFADSREILQKRIQCRIVRAAQRQIMDTAPWPRVLHELRFCEKHLGDAIERELLGLTAVKVVKLHGCFSQKCALE